MGSVYSSSACAFIWLGPGNEASDQALSLIDSLQEMLLEYVPGHNVRETMGNVSLPEDMVLPGDDQAWADLEVLFSRPWFDRTWTFQEPIRAPERMIACGSKMRSWSTFEDAIVLPLNLRHGGKAIIDLNAFLTLSIFIEKGPKDLRLSQLIYTTWQREASDRRDKVYALYGLVQDYQKVPLEISYAMSVEDVYRSTVRFCIENERSLSILTHVSRMRTLSDLPSWVPDWRNRIGSGCNPVDAMYVNKFNASSMAQPLLMTSSSNDKLILKGFVLATVERTIDITALGLTAEDSSPESWKTVAAAAGVPVRFLQGKAFKTSYDLTITMENSPLHSEFATRFSALSWAKSISWIAAGRPRPIPRAVLTEYKEEIFLGTRRRRMFLTKDSLGLAPATTQVGDRVCILLGGNEPFILRPCPNTARAAPCEETRPNHQSLWETIRQNLANAVQYGSKERGHVAKQALEATEWTLIGDCYLHGYMRGEAMETVTEDDYVNFTLV